MEIITEESVPARDRAGVLRGEFIVARNRVLTMDGAVKKLRTKYEKLTNAYLRAEGTTYAMWLELGPKAEWEEVLAATRDEAVWDRLLERCAPAAKDVGA